MSAMDILLLAFGAGFVCAVPTLTIWKITQRSNVAVDRIDWFVVFMVLVSGPVGLVLELKEQHGRRQRRAINTI